MNFYSQGGNGAIGGHQSQMNESQQTKFNIDSPSKSFIESDECMIVGEGN